jgi:hypothetical protein
LLRLNERDRYLREAARLYCAGMSDRAAAEWLRIRLRRYREGAFRRDRSEPLCPARHRGTVVELCWMILRTRDHVPSISTIRRALGYS